ncbi:protein spinster homolog 1 [Planococcus citri]|uniref:protein spinster homolog 1 n=1 Tax=Planococcus citri TaxID=170843 RepID=UPI0031F8A175
MMIALKEKLSFLYNGYVLTILTLGYLSSELGHFLIGVTSKATATDVHYGDIKCQLNKTKPHFNLTLHEHCQAADSADQCYELLLEDGQPYCEWNYNGLGFDYQILAGPCFIAVYTVIGVFFGIAADKYNRSRLVSLSFLITSVSVALMGLTDAYWQLVLLRVLLATGEAGCNPLSTGILSDLFPEDKRGLVMSIFNWGIYAGIGLAFPIGRYITELDLWGQSWRMAYYISGAFGLIIAFLSALTVPEPARKTIGEEREENNENSVANRTVMDTKLEQEEKKEDAWKVLLQPRVIMLCIAASIRHTGGICFAYNADLFYRDIFPNYDLGWWLFFVTFVVGSTGVIAGGILSDKVAAKMGIRSRVAVLAISQLIATPFAFGSIYLQPVGAMVTLAISYVFAEMWFGILFAILVEIVPLSVRSTTVGVFLFVMNNIGGNLPILVEPVRKASSYRHSLAIFYAGFYLVSSVLFAITTLMMGNTTEKDKKSGHAHAMAGVENGGFVIERIPGHDFSTGIYESHHL